MTHETPSAGNDPLRPLVSQIIDAIDTLTDARDMCDLVGRALAGAREPDLRCHVTGLLKAEDAINETLKILETALAPFKDASGARLVEGRA